MRAGAGSDNGFKGIETQACGNALVGNIPEDAIRLTVETKDGEYLFRDKNGKYLSCYGSNILKLDEKTDGNSEWIIRDAAEGSADDGNKNIALEFYE